MGPVCLSAPGKAQTAAAEARISGNGARAAADSHSATLHPCRAPTGGDAPRPAGPAYGPAASLHARTPAHDEKQKALRRSRRRATAGHPHREGWMLASLLWVLPTKPCTKDAARGLQQRGILWGCIVSVLPIGGLARVSRRAEQEWVLRARCGELSAVAPCHALRVVRPPPPPPARLQPPRWRPRLVDMQTCVWRVAASGSSALQIMPSG